MSYSNYLVSLVVFATTFNVFAEENTQSEKNALNSKEKQMEVLSILGQRTLLRTETGSATLIDEAALEQFEFDDIHRVLQSVPGVYVREEDGFGLRPNIGLRGATTERSSKIAIMEDGVLIAPAPYAAPAAYYFPLVSRMSQVEVFKGPAAILYGPNTVGGAINMISRPIESQYSDDWQTHLDFAYGQFNSQKAHGVFSIGEGDFAAQLEWLHLSSDGFKELNNSADQNTGFEKQAWLLKTIYEPSDSAHEQYWQFKAGVSTETSNETYLGLTDSDFKKSPYTRYAASAKDKMDWEHYQFQLSHYIELSSNLNVFTQAYHREFDRDWDRFNGFSTNRTMETILSSPDTGLNALYMQVLTGERDTLTQEEQLVFTLNDRRFLSQGIETKINYNTQWHDVGVDVMAGLRLHQDQVERNHRAQHYRMVSGQMEPTAEPNTTTTNNKDSAFAIASFINAKLQFKQLTSSFGMRIESIDSTANDNLLATEKNGNSTIILPGLGLFYQLNEQMGFLFGVNKGFVPNSPGQDDNVKPEESWNYEAGYRFGNELVRAEMIGFFNDYKNLKASCTFSSGCDDTLDKEFNGGAVHVFGIEATLNSVVALPLQFSLPINIAYTHTQSEFQNSFSSSFSQWGDIDIGDQLPYLPEHQVSITVGLQRDNWNLSLVSKYATAMLEQAGISDEVEMTDETMQIDLSAWYLFTPKTKVYFKLDNLTDNTTIVSRRPFGARPSKPTMATLGIKYQF